LQLTTKSPRLIPKNLQIYTGKRKYIFFYVDNWGESDYFKKVQKVLIDVLSGGGEKEIIQFRTVRDAITADVGLDIGSEGSLAIQRGNNDSNNDK